VTELAIATERLVKRYGRARGLAGLDLEVQRGEVYGFLGPNGAGKTTTIRLLLDLSRPIRSLSKGNRQKLGLVQAFMHAPELLILDEPTGGLDPLLQRQFIAMTREVKQAGRTVFMSSHVLSEVQQTADRVGIIRDGRLVTVERVEALRERAVDPPGLPLALVPGW
jgi:ABC-2 type transport system ATP-binding protein